MKRKKTMRRRIQKLAEELFHTQWYWYSMVRMLAQEDIRRHADIYILKMRVVLPEMSYITQKISWIESEKEETELYINCKFNKEIMTNLSDFYDLVKGFANDHDMVNQFLFIGSDEELDMIEFDYKDVYNHSC